MKGSVCSAAWAAQERTTANFGDARLNKRLIRIVTDKLAKPTASIPQASGGWAATKATYRFFASHQVRADAFRAPHRDATVQRVWHHHPIVVLQDTTELDYTAHPNTRGRGHLDTTHCHGLNVPSGLAATVDGVPLGVLHQAVWARVPATNGTKRRNRPQAEKESQRWLIARAGGAGAGVAPREPRGSRAPLQALAAGAPYDPAPA
ncbi:MAG TPA: transposase DNA-binding-containing protein [Chloroflexaceae bacterium]|nr:transposase DNA-binding-containing protein [Chloroflexaceae bacterium]